MVGKFAGMLGYGVSPDEQLVMKPVVPALDAEGTDGYAGIGAVCQWHATTSQLEDRATGADCCGGSRRTLVINPVGNLLDDVPLEHFLHLGKTIGAAAIAKCNRSVFRCLAPVAPFIIASGYCDAGDVFTQNSR